MQAARHIKKYKENILVDRFVKLFSIDGLVSASGVLLLPVYLKLMTQAEFGLFNYLLTIITTVSLILNYGLSVAQSKLYHAYKDDEERGTFLFTLNMIQLLFLSGVLFILYFLKLDYRLISLLFKNEIDYESYRPAVLLAVIVSVYSLILINYFLTSEKISLVRKFGFLKLILVHGVVIILLYMMPVDSVMVRLKYSFLIEGLVILIFSYPYLKSMFLRFNLSQAVRSVKLGFPMMLAAIVGIIINSGDKFFLERYGNFIDLSIYYLAFSLSAVIPIIFMTVQNVWQPLFFKENDISMNIIKTRKLIVYLACFLIGISLVTLFAVELLLSFGIISSEYRSVMRVLPIVLLTQILSSIVPLYSNYLIYFEKTYLIPTVGFFIGGICILLNLWLVPGYGIYGAAASSFLTHLVYLITEYTIVTVYIRKYQGLEHAGQAV
ncbi:MAG: oligosaccharide flippase family protein [Nitrospirae bacterium]|nr:oligosaccharide flippase family protein [Nitrospirota bacterium]